MTMQATNLQTKQFLKALYPQTAGQNINLWSKRKSKKTTWYKLLSADILNGIAEEAVKQTNEGWDVYISICPISDGADYIGKSGKRSQAIHVSEIPAFFMDIDTLLDPKKREKGAILPQDINAASETLLQLENPPSMLVGSGQGIHAYWLFDEALEATQENVSALKSFAVMIKDITGWADLDTSASEPARVLRVAGTSNYKQGEHSPLTVELLHLSEQRYNADRLKETLKDYITTPLELSEETEHTSITLSNDEIIQRCRNQRESGAEFSELFDKGHSGTDDSAEDYKLCRLIAYHTLNAARVETVFNLSALAKREKWQTRADYRDLTIQKAIDQVKTSKGTNTRIKGLEEPLNIFQTYAETAEEGTTDGRPHLSYNIFCSVLQEQGISIKDNLVTKDLEFTGLPNTISDENILNIAPAFIRDEFLKAQYKQSDRTTVEEYITRTADINRYSPVVEWLQGLNYDESNAIEWLCDEVLHLDEDDKLSRTLIRKWLVQCVAMAHNGITSRTEYGADGVLTLQGAQGTGKTSFFRELVPNQKWCKTGIQVDMNNKDDHIKATSTWITELGEVDSTFKKEQSALKAFITSERDDVRPPYARASVKKPRRTSFCATVNDEDYLRDPTGSRRWWTIPIEGFINWKLLREEDHRSQIWAEAYEIWLHSPQGFRLEAEESRNLAKRNGDHEVLMTGEDELLSAFIFNWEDCDEKFWEWSSATEIKQKIHCSASAVQIGKVLVKLSMVEPKIRQTKIGNKRVWRVPPIRWEGYTEAEDQAFAEYWSPKNPKRAEFDQAMKRAIE